MKELLLEYMITVAVSVFLAVLLILGFLTLVALLYSYLG